MALLGAGLAACSNGSGGGGSNPFVGSWACTGTQSLTFTQPAGAQPQTNNQSFTQTIVANGDGSITATTTGDAGNGCTFKWTVSGSTATLEANQTCTNTNGVVASYTSGTATVSGTTLTHSNQFTFSGTITATPDGGQPQQVQVAGTGTGENTCTKQ
jgi:hypothetical protein